MFRGTALAQMVPGLHIDEKSLQHSPLISKGDLVGVRGFEPPASASRTQRSTRLSHTPLVFITADGGAGFKRLRQGLFLFLLRLLDFRFAHLLRWRMRRR